MIPEQDAETILANLTRHAPLDLDAALFAPAAEAIPLTIRPAAFPPAETLWDMPEEERSHIGVRIREPVVHADVLAARLAAIALERNIHPVFLSHIGNCGMQRFGFRVERVFGVDRAAQAAFEAQLTRFWRLALIVDAAEVARLA